MSKLKDQLDKTLKSPEQILQAGGRPKSQRRKLDATLSTDTQKGSNGGSLEALHSQRRGERQACKHSMFVVKSKLSLERCTVG